METTKFEVRRICATCLNCQGGRCYRYENWHPPVEHNESCDEWGKANN